MRKFGRNFFLTIEAQDGEFITFTLPLTIEFDIYRNNLESTNTGVFRIYNLSERTRLRLLHDQQDYANYRSIAFQGGYGDNLASLPILFKGNIFECFSIRQGTNFITELHCQDGGIANILASYEQGFPLGYNNQDIITDMINSLSKYHVEPGAIGNFRYELKRGVSFSGPTVELISELTGNSFFIDNEKAYALQDGEFLAAQNEPPIISSDSGLLGTPRREQFFLTFDTILEPDLKIGQQIQLKSTTTPPFNNAKMKVLSLAHKGTISESVCGDAVTTIGADYSQILVDVVQANTKGTTP